MGFLGFSQRSAKCSTQMDDRNVTGSLILRHYNWWVIIHVHRTQVETMSSPQTLSTAKWWQQFEREIKFFKMKMTGWMKKTDSLKYLDILYKEREDRVGYFSLSSLLFADDMILLASWTWNSYYALGWFSVGFEVAVKWISTWGHVFCQTRSDCSLLFKTHEFKRCCQKLVDILWSSLSTL